MKLKLKLKLKVKVILGASILFGFLLVVDTVFRHSVPDIQVAEIAMPLEAEESREIAAVSPLEGAGITVLENGSADVVEGASKSAPSQESETGTETPLDTAAIQSLANARLKGDDRMPVIGRSEPRSLPSQEELEDPDLYLQYEARQTRHLYKAYVISSEKKIALLEDSIRRARKEGMSEDEISIALEKVKRIKAMRHELLNSNPNLLE